MDLGSYLNESWSPNMLLSLSMQGRRFRDEIHMAMTNNTFFREKILPYNQTEAGAVLYGSYLSSSICGGDCRHG